MPIDKGEAWGERGALPAEGVVARSDAEARAVVERARRAGAEVPVVGLLGGDLAAAVGGRGDEARLHDGEGIRLPVDVGAVRIDGQPFWFVAHLVARRSWWRGRIVAVMNTDLLGSWHVAPRAHPGDGRFDVVDADPPLADRLRARRRLASGAHLPHPAIAVSAVSHVALDLDPPLDIWLDGDRVARGSHLEVTVEPDALTVVV
jgi:hypothetical protein